MFHLFTKCPICKSEIIDILKTKSWTIPLYLTLGYVLRQQGYVQSVPYLIRLSPIFNTKITLTTQKTYHIPQENSYISLILFFKMIHSNEIF